MLKRALLGLILLSSVLTEETCVDKLEWTTDKGYILVNGQPLVLKGIKYNGFESTFYAPHGLNKRNLNHTLDILKDNGFNVVTIPFSMELVKSNPDARNISCNHNPELCELTAIGLLDAFIDRAADRGLLVSLSNKKFTANGSSTPALWYDAEYSEATVIELWSKLVNRYTNMQKKWNLFAIDLKNQPNSMTDDGGPGASWGDSNKDTDWNKAAERMITKLSAFEGLFMVDGVIAGVILTGAGEHPIDTKNETLNKRVVYSAHVYGPSVFNRSEFGVDDFSDSLDALYMEEWGFLVAKGHAVVVGDWGGKFEPGTRDEEWNLWFADWLKQKCLTNNNYWSLNPNIDPFPGLLRDDWRTLNVRKRHLVNSVQPNPTKFEKLPNGKIRITAGVFPGSHCQAAAKKLQQPAAISCEA